MPRRGRILAAGIAVALVSGLALAGCTGGGSTPPPRSTPTPTASPGQALSGLLPVQPKKLDAATAKTEATRLADVVDGLIDKNSVVYVDSHAEVVPATKSAASYYGVLRTVTVSTKLDPVEQAEAMERILVAAGWTERDSGTDKGKYLAALVSGTGSKAWFLLIGGDSTEAKSPVVTVQVASPDLG